MTVALTSLIVPLTKDQYMTTFVGLLALTQLPVTSWQSGGVVDTIIQIDAQSYADLSTTIANIAQGNYLGLAQGPWLDLLMQSQFQDQRKPAVFTQGTLVLTDPAGAGPFTVNAGAMFVLAGSLRFYNVATFTLPKNGTVSPTFSGEFAGSSYNVGINSITSFQTPLPGVTVNNPSIGGTGTWITQSGTDAETDAAATLRMQAKWATLSAAPPALAYYYWAQSTSNQVTRVKVLEQYPAGGQVTVVLAGASGAVDPTSVVAPVNAFIQTKRPLVVQTFVVSATNHVITISCQLTCSLATLAATQVAVQANLVAYQASLGINAVVELAIVEQQIMNATGAINIPNPGQSGALQINGAAADVTLGPLEVVPPFILNITYAGV